MHALEVLAVHLDERDVLALELVLDERTLEERVERVEQLEARVDVHAVVEGLREDGAEAALELLDLVAEGVEVVVEGLPLHLHDVVGDGLEGGDGGLEVRKDRLERCVGRKGLKAGRAHLEALGPSLTGRQRLALGAADDDALELAAGGKGACVEVRSRPRTPRRRGRPRLT